MFTARYGWENIPLVPSLKDNHQRAIPGNDATSFLGDTSIHNKYPILQKEQKIAVMIV